LEITQSLDLEKNKLSVIIDLIRQKQQLEDSAKKGRLVSADLEFLQQAEDALQEYLNLIEKIRELNRIDTPGP
jgi:hypothetical protein